MLDWLAGRLEVSPAVAGFLLVLIVVQVLAQVYALVDLMRRAAVRGGKKWVWALVIVLLNLPGAIAYLVAGRTVSSMEGSDASGTKTVGEEGVRKAVDTIYGARDRR